MKSSITGACEGWMLFSLDIDDRAPAVVKSGHDSEGDKSRNRPSSRCTFQVRGFKNTEQQQEIAISALKGLEEVREIFMKTAAGRGATKEFCFLVSAMNYS